MLVTEFDITTHRLLLCQIEVLLIARVQRTVEGIIYDIDLDVPQLHSFGHAELSEQTPLSSLHMYCTYLGM